MLSFSAPTRAIFGWPKAVWYGLCASLISGVLWTVMALVFSTNPLPESAISPVLWIFSVVIDLTPVVLVVTRGVQMGRRNGSVRDGLVVGVIAGGALAVVYLVAVEVILLRAAIGETLAWHTNAALVLLEYAKDDCISALFYAVIGGIVGGLGALVGRRWHCHDQPAWRESAGLAVCGIDTAELDAEVLKVVTVEALGNQLPTLAE